MCRQAELDLPPVPTSVRHARHFVHETCQTWQLGGDVADEIVLAVSELVTNAVLHAGTALTVSMTVDVAKIMVAIRDHDPRPPVLRPVRLDLVDDLDAMTVPAPTGSDDRHGLQVGSSGSIAAGRGMIIVDAIADEWGVSDRADGKDVWFSLPTPRSWPHLSECGGEDPAAGRPIGYAGPQQSAPGWNPPAAG